MRSVNACKTGSYTDLNKGSLEIIAEQSHHAFFVTRSLDDRKMGSLETIFQNESEEIVERSSTGVCRNDRSSLQQ